MQTRKLISIYQHPFKGLSPALLHTATLLPEFGMHGDRVFALQFRDEELVSDLDENTESVPWMSKKHLAVQHDWPQLARLSSSFDFDSKVLQVIHSSSGTLLEESTVTQEGRSRIGAFFTGFLAGQTPPSASRHPKVTPLRLIGSFENQTTHFQDNSAPFVSLCLRETIDSLGKAAGTELDARRFRINLILEGGKAWQEFEWIGRKIRVGSCLLEVIKPISRCLNIDANPTTGERDIPLLATLKREFQHTNTGVFARVLEGGNITTQEEWSISHLD